ncbi:MAG: hypothetical protein ACO20I_15980 [bacterium]
MNALIRSLDLTASPHDIFLLKNEIVRLRAAHYNCSDPEQRHILRIEISVLLRHYQELTRPPSLSEQVG